MPNLFHAILFSCCLHISHCKLEKVMAEGDAGGTMSVTLHGVTDTLSPENKKHAGALKAAAEAFHDAEEIFNDPTYANKTGWWEDKTNDDGDIVYAKDTPKGRIVTVSAEMSLDVDNVMSHTWKDVATLPQWNPNINFASVIASPTDNFDVITYGNNDVLVVSGREFVSGRIYRKTHDGYILASRSYEIPGIPKMKGKVRANLILAGARFRRHPEKADVTLTDVVMMVDLKGMLPKFLVNQVMGKIMLMDTENNRKHFGELAKQKANGGAAKN
ncbi:hypothetical protein WR25_22308 [Diploscapter pachys]|uniref:START domain-containing protein n=1 Tax=Diploscapter pachys TaxID=2018661 RepID=A0A2A2K4E7_9BILA|nr:hypothetical protein WR25_22308 [Diploscapter pachys]